MEARFAKAALLAAALLSCGANWRSENFVIVSAPSDQIAQEVAAQAEHYRRELASQWLGRELPRWRDPCPIVVGVGPREPSRGKTTFVPTGGEPYGWQMEVFGTRERVLDSVLPHEILHTVFATHFGVPLPRWADEGACTTVEHESERDKQEANLVHYLKSDRGISFNKMFAMTEYPRDMLPLYAQGYSVTRFLIARGGERKFVDYVGDGLTNRSWTKATQRHYGFSSLAELQIAWLDWVKQGSPPLSPHAEPTPQQLTDSDGRSIQAQIGRLRGGKALEADDRPVPQVPSTFASKQRDQQTSLARPESGGWYKKQRGEGSGASAPARMEPTVRGQEPEVFPPPEHQGNAAKASGIEPQRLVPLRRSSAKTQVAGTGPAGTRQVLLEWKRPAGQPWRGGPVAEVALRSEPRASARPRAAEYFDAPLTPDGTIWR